jgi:hypothetical protein
MVSSAEKDSGKSTLLGVLGFIVPRAYPTVELTGPGLYRIVDLLHPTLIVDEADKLFARKNDLLHICNAGWSKGTKVTRIVSGFPREFDTFCPKAIGMKGLNVPDTLASRGIIIKMWPKREEEKVDDFRYQDDETFAALRRKAARWARDHGDKVAAAQPAMPIGFSNRTAANWKMLFAIAELAGCSKQAHRAAIALVVKRRGQSSEGLRLLAAIREVLGSAAMITSAELVKKLIADGNAEWCEFRARGGDHAAAGRCIARPIRHPPCSVACGQALDHGARLQGRMVQRCFREIPADQACNRIREAAVRDTVVRLNNTRISAGRGPMATRKSGQYGDSRPTMTHDLGHGTAAPRHASRQRHAQRWSPPSAFCQEGRLGVSALLPGNPAKTL